MEKEFEDIKYELDNALSTLKLCFGYSLKMKFIILFFGFVVSTFLMFPLFYLSNYFHSISQILILTFFFPIVMIGPIILYKIDLSYGYELYQEVTSIQKILLRKIDSVQTINEVLYRTKKILSLLSQISVLYKFSPWIFTKKTTETLGNILLYLPKFFIPILLDLRSDLQLRLEEQQKTLEQAKSEVEQNIHGTSELNQVSELQKARLDRQIAQFEELQRVLVKV